MPKKCTIDRILALKVLMDYKRKYWQSFFTAFVNFCKAFDSVDRATLWDILRLCRIPPKLLDIMSGLYTDTVNAVNGSLCQCGSPREKHVAVTTEDNFSAAMVSKWDPQLHTKEEPTDAYGTLEFSGVSRKQSHFLRCSNSTDPKIIYNMLTGTWNIPPPNLVVSVMGGSDKMKAWMIDVLRQGLVRAAQSTGAWIITKGIRTGIGRYVGEAVRDHATARTQSSNKVVALGVVPWGMVHNNHLLVNAKRVEQSVKNSIPWMIVARSGGVADFLCDIYDEAVTQEGLADVLEDKVKKHFPGQNMANFTELNIMQHKDLLTIYDVHQDGTEDFDTLILKSLVKACKKQETNAIEYIDELKLAVAWNRVDIARSELFKSVVHWKFTDLEDPMTDALVNDKPDFVKLFIENGLSVFEYLTYKRLEELYCSVPEHSLIYHLLMRKHSERKEILFTKEGPIPPEEMEKGKNITLYEVSKVLHDLLGGVCHPMYSDDVLMGTTDSAKRPVTNVSNAFHKNSDKYHLHVIHPWTSLFIWAVLQNRREMAAYFWEMAGDSVVSALAACKILKEMSRLENETETKVSMKELSARFEQLAHDMFSECYRSSESRAFTLLIRQSPTWGKATALLLATEADARHFFSQDGVQSLLTQIWWGDIHQGTAIWKLIIHLFIPPLVYTSLIKYRNTDEETKEEEQHKLELESFEGDTVLSLNDILSNDSDTEEMEALKGNHKDVSSHGVKPQPQRPFYVTRWKKFWNAPVTAFLGNVIMYFTFLFLFSYVLLLDFQPPPPSGPSNSEIVLYIWVATLVCEEVRQSFFVGNLSIKQKLKYYFEDIWNKCDVTAISLFIIGLICRMFPFSYDLGRTFLCLDFMIFTLRLIHIFAVHKQLGPKIIIVGKMMKDVFFFLFFLGVWLLAYGVTTQGLLHPNDSRVDWIFRRVFYRPYLHIFGQIPLDEIDASHISIQNCTNDPVEIMMGDFPPCTNTYANWVVILLLVIYLLVTNILLLNLLIAMFSYTFSTVQGCSDIHWKFQRYNLIVEYHNRPALPPPFIIFSHIHLFIKRCIRKIESIKKRHFMVELEKRQDSRLMTWEAVQKENFLVQQNKLKRESDSERLKRTSAKSSIAPVHSHGWWSLLRKTMQTSSADLHQFLRPRDHSSRSTLATGTITDVGNSSPVHTVRNDHTAYRPVVCYDYYAPSRSYELDMGTRPEFQMDKYASRIVTLSCVSNDWYPAPVVSWVVGEDGKPMASEKSEDIANNKAHINVRETLSLRAENDLQVTCIMSNPVLGTKTQETLRITGDFPPDVSPWFIAFIVLFLIVLAIAAWVAWKFWEKKKIIKANVTLLNSDGKSSTPFSSGHHYWEVDVGEKNWAAGLVKEGVELKGGWDVLKNMSPDKGVWALAHKSNLGYRALIPTSTGPFPITPASDPKKLGCLLDWDEKQLSIYDVGRTHRLFTFDCDSDKPVYPFLRLNI
ncbi:TRPM5 protein, partial [Polypterus senegalus]